jgi:hypothetical protein
MGLLESCQQLAPAVTGWTPVLSRYSAGYLRSRTAMEVQHPTESLTSLYRCSRHRRCGSGLLPLAQNRPASATHAEILQTRLKIQRSRLRLLSQTKLPGYSKIGKRVKFNSAATSQDLS